MKSIFVSVIAAILSCSQPQQDGGAAKKLTPTEYKQQAVKEGVLLDVRTPEEFQAGALQDAENSDYRGGEFAEDMKSWDKDKTYYLYCASGNRSGKAAQLLLEAGFKNVYNIGAYTDLKAAGIPVKE